MAPKKTAQKAVKKEIAKTPKAQKSGLFLQIEAQQEVKQLLADKFKGCASMKCCVDELSEKHKPDAIIIPKTSVEVDVSTRQIVATVWFEGENGLEGLSNIGIALQRQGNRIIVEVSHAQDSNSKMQVLTVASPTFIAECSTEKFTLLRTGAPCPQILLNKN